MANLTLIIDLFHDDVKHKKCDATLRFIGLLVQLKSRIKLHVTFASHFDISTRNVYPLYHVFYALKSSFYCLDPKLVPLWLLFQKKVWTFQRC